jgi:hypothetical protein
MSSAASQFAVAFQNNDEMLQAAENNLKDSIEYYQQAKEFMKTLGEYQVSYVFSTPSEQNQYGIEVEAQKSKMEMNKDACDQLVESIAAVEKRLKASKTIKAGTDRRIKATKEINEARKHLDELKIMWACVEGAYQSFKALCEKTAASALSTALTASVVSPRSLTPTAASREATSGESKKGYSLYFKQGVQKYKDTTESINDWLGYIQQRGHKAGLTPEEMYRAIVDHLEGDAASWLVRQRFPYDHTVEDLVKMLIDAFGATSKNFYHPEFFWRFRVCT